MAETTTHFLPRNSERVFRLLLPLLCCLLLADSYKDCDASEIVINECRSDRGVQVEGERGIRDAENRGMRLKLNWPTTAGTGFAFRWIRLLTGSARTCKDCGRVKWLEGRLGLGGLRMEPRAGGISKPRVSFFRRKDLRLMLE
jgi:hypothetical protein